MKKGKREVFGIKADPEIVEQLKAVNASFESGHDCAVAFLEAYKKVNEDASDDSPVTAQARVIDKLLSEVKKVTTSYMVVAESEAESRLEEMKEKVLDTFNKNQTLTTEIREAQNTIKGLEDENKDQRDLVGALTASAESTGVLKLAWESREKTYTEQIAALNKMAPDAQALKTKLAEAQAKLTAQNDESREATRKQNDEIRDGIGKLALTQQKLETTEALVASQKAQISKLEQSMEKAQDDTRQANLDFKQATQVRIEATTALAEEKANAQINDAKQQAVIKKHSAKIHDLKAELEALKPVEVTATPAPKEQPPKPQHPNQKKNR